MVMKALPDRMCKRSDSKNVLDDNHFEEDDDDVIDPNYIPVTDGSEGKIYPRLSVVLSLYCHM